MDVCYPAWVFLIKHNLVAAVINSVEDINLTFSAAASN